MEPALYYLAKALSMGTKYLYETIRGLREMSLHNPSQFSQFPIAAAVILVERPSEMSSTAVQKLSWKRLHLAGSTVAIVVSGGRCCPCGQSVWSQ